MRHLFLAVLAALLPGTLTVSQQQPTPLRGAVSGTVIDGATGAAVPDAFVTLTSQPASLLPADYQNRQISDAKGRFVFLNLPDGQFEITAGKFGISRRRLRAGQRRNRSFAHHRRLEWCLGWRPQSKHLAPFHNLRYGPR